MLSWFGVVFVDVYVDGGVGVGVGVVFVDVYVDGGVGVGVCVVVGVEGAEGRRL